MVKGIGKAKGKSGARTSQVSRSARAGLTFPVGRISRMLKDGKYCQRIGATAPVCLAAVLEYIVAEILEVSVMVVRQKKKARIIPRFIYNGLSEDEEFKRLFKKAIITESGVRPMHRSCKDSICK